MGPNVALTWTQRYQFHLCLSQQGQVFQRVHSDRVKCLPVKGPPSCSSPPHPPDVTEPSQEAGVAEAATKTTTLRDT